MKAYIAGKITGDSDYKKKFAHAKDWLEAERFVVLNPAELPEGMRPADYMRICMAMMDSADVVAFLPDYWQSRGAQLEWTYCQYVSKTIMYLDQISTKMRRKPRMFKPGDKVRMNSNYHVSEENQNKVWKVRSEPWMCCGTLVVALEGEPGGYAVDGLDLVEEAKRNCEETA